MPLCADLSEVMPTLKNILKLLHPATKRQSFSGASVELRDAALKERHLVILPTRVTDYDGYAGPQAMPAFPRWDSFCRPVDASASAVASSEKSNDSKHDEVAATEALLRHVSHHLGLPPGTHVANVRSANSLFTLRIRSEHIRGSGSTDGCICETAHAGLGERSAARAAICLVELKTPGAMRDHAEKCVTQAILELLGASVLCGYPVPVVLTSLLEPSHDVPGIRVFVQEGGAVRDFTGAEGGPLTLAEARGVLSVLLPATLAARKKFILATLARVPEVYGDGDDDDDDAGDEDDANDADEGDEDYVPGPARDGGGVASDRVLRGNRRGGAASSTPKTHSAGAPASSGGVCNRSASSLADNLYAELEEEERIQRARALIHRSPQILQLLQCNTANLRLG